MNFKRWLREEKGGGGLGAILIIVIIAAAIYAVQYGPSNLLYEPEPAFAEATYIPPEETYEAESQNYGRDSASLHHSVHTSREPEAAEPDSPDRVEPEPKPVENRDEPAVASATKSKTEVTTKAKTKPKTKPKRSRLSNEQLVKRKLEQGKTVKQIADETGLDRKYIREVKRRSQQVVW
ncbi:hypothetical protein AAE02nite_39060 [Adhaeribacter aerolatus]|uniref:Uncharacterized protein n=1 Tax=Adhaeribacter aerolatus TaxID=670289 RepID=A0A512B2P1_9BACT|nr:hypothetical protein [Adhaeribacter aerolatus]GEO06242.1 hypothetical protein AAE02nite_39060 [Adhaeribacter aerolatus]